MQIPTFVETSYCTMLVAKWQLLQTCVVSPNSK